MIFLKLLLVALIFRQTAENFCSRGDEKRGSKNGRVLREMCLTGLVDEYNGNNFLILYSYDRRNG
jgi:hypothetical protein